MLCIVEETKDEIKSYVDANATYENLKKVVDIRPIPNVRVKPKYGRIYYTTLFTNFLLLTNHADALQIPEKDRRIACVTNNNNS